MFPTSAFQITNFERRSEIAVRLSGNAVAVVSDSFLCHDPAGQSEMFSAYYSEIVVENDAGKTLAVDRLKIDGQAFRESCPGSSGSFAAQATIIIAGLDFASRAVAGELQKIKLDRDEAVMGSSQLPNSAGAMVRVLAADGAALKLALHQAWCAMRLALKGSVPEERRK